MGDSERTGSGDGDPVLVLGTSWCEDTALVRSRLHALGVPFEEQDVESDPAAGERIRALNGGHQITPTVVLDEATSVAEPTLEQLTTLLAAAGWAVRSPAAVQYRAPITQVSIPRRPPPASGAGDPSLDTIRGRRGAALFLAHRADCLACLGYARRLVARRDALRDADGEVLVIVEGGAETVEAWRHDLGSGIGLGADASGEWKRAVAAHVGFDPGDAALLILDRWQAARAGSIASEAGGLIDPSEALSWLEHLTLECPECAGEIAWESPPD